MAPNPESQRHNRAKPFPGQRELTIKYETGTGPGEMAAKLLELSEEGMSVEIPSLLELGLSVEIVGDILGADGPQPLHRHGFVRRCWQSGDGRIMAAMFFQSNADSSTTETAEKESEAVDHYELLELSRNANPETIHRVFRILAKRYHPDNKETGNVGLFRQIVEAARVLTNPELRAAYDARLGVQTQNRFKIFETWQTSRGIEGEKRKRMGILAMLYGRRLTDPHHPTLSARDLEQMLDCPREHLEFSLWFLRENKWIRGGDNGRYEITSQGVLIAEEQEEAYPSRPPVPRLTAPKEEQ